MLIKKLFYKNNVECTKNLVKLCRKFKIKKFIFSSSCAVYGVPRKNIVTEKSRLKPVSYYGLTKLKSEHLITKNSKSNKVNYIIFRFFNVCSSLKKIGENHNPETHLIPLVVQKYIEKKELMIYIKSG